MAEIISFDGNVIDKSGLYANIPIETYHRNPFLCSKPSISKTGLMDFKKKPSFYWEYSPYNLLRSEKPPKKHFDFGRAVHHLILGESGFSKHFAVRPDTYPNDRNKAWNGNANDCKAWLASMERMGRTVMTRDDLERIKRIAEKLEKLPEVQNGIFSGQIEVTMLVDAGNWFLRSRPDAVPASGDFFDLKTTSSLSYDYLSKAIGNFGYYLQCGMTAMCCEMLGVPFNGMALVFAETDPPFDVISYQAADEDIAVGIELIDVSLRYLDKCVERQEWPSEAGFNSTMTTIHMPSWMRTQIQNDIQYMKAEAS